MTTTFEGRLEICGEIQEAEIASVWVWDFTEAI